MDVNNEEWQFINPDNREKVNNWLQSENGPPEAFDELEAKIEGQISRVVGHAVIVTAWDGYDYIGEFEPI